jgi:hypothetical protein
VVVVVTDVNGWLLGWMFSGAENYFAVLLTSLYWLLVAADLLGMFYVDACT